MRTLDRYIKSKKLSTRTIAGRIWLDKGDIGRFKSEGYGQIKVDNVDMSTLKKSIDNRSRQVDNGVDRIDKVDVFDGDSAGFKMRKNDAEGGTYKKLFNELREEIKEKQERLEIANYRVGQLEAQLRNSIPMLEYHRENYEKKRFEENLNKKLEQSTNLIKKLSIKLKQSNFIKRIFIIILLIILALQPLWLLPHLDNIF
ncbi:MAG: hypothetical protein O3B47_00160 [bacterium]|nr:hypothetical protein [bacterium]